MNELQFFPIVRALIRGLVFTGTFGLVCVFGCTTSHRVDDVDYYDRAICGKKLIVFAVRERGRDYTRWGPDPQSSWTRDLTEVYRLIYDLNSEDVGRIIAPSIEKIINIEGDLNFTMEPYLPPDSYEIGETKKYGIAWRYTDELYSSTVDLYVVLSNELTAVEINHAAELGYPVALTKRFYETPLVKIMWSAEQEYGPAYRVYCVTSGQLYAFPKNVDISLGLIFPSDGCVYFSETHSKIFHPSGKKYAIFKWNPISGLGERWFLDLPKKRSLTRMKMGGDEQ